MIISIKKLNQYLITFIFIDLMLLPVLPKVHLPISCIIVFFIYLKEYNRIKKMNLIKSTTLFAFILVIIISMLLSYFFKPSIATINNGVLNSSISVHFEDFKKAMQLGIALLYFVSSLFLIKGSDKEVVKKMCRNCITITLLLASMLFVLSTINFGQYIALRNIVFGVKVDLTDISAIVYSGYLQRYLFILLDPNNACYFLQMLALYQIGFLETKGAHYYLALLVLVASPFATRSSGGIAATIICLVLFFFNAVKRFKIRKTTMLVLGSLICLLCVVSVFVQYSDTPSLDALLQESHDIIQRWSTNSMDYRYERYFYIFRHFILYPIGFGYTLIKNGYVVSPHSDHLRVLYAYGFIPYIYLFMKAYKYVRIKFEYIFLIPVLIAFTINSVIDEPRFLYTFVVLLAIVIEQTKIKKYTDTTVIRNDWS